MNITRVILEVSDLARAVSFWSETVGFPVQTKSEAFAFLDAGPIQLVLNERGEPGPASDTELVIEAEDFAEAYRQAVERGVPFEVEPRPVTSDGSRDLMATHFRDPDGNLASLTGWV